MAAKPPRRRSDNPIGTKAELAGNPFWKLSEWPTCSAPDRLNNELGCPAWSVCPFSGGVVYDRETPAYKGVAGPAYFGVQLIKETAGSGDTKIVHTMLPCWQIPSMADRMEENGGILRIVALEGEEVDLPGSEPKDELFPGQGMVRIYTQKVCTQKVPKFPRPTGNPALRDNAFAAAQAKKFATARRESKAEGYLGELATKHDATDAPEPTDVERPRATRG